MHHISYFLLLAFVARSSAGVVTRVNGPADSEVTHASVGGNIHIYLTGTDIGTPFAPPSVRVGINGGAECIVQGFTSSRTRMHCIIGAAGLPAPRPVYSAGRVEQYLPLYVVGTDGAHADCWHVGGINHGCFLLFDVGGTPRLDRVLTTAVGAGGIIRVAGRGMDGGTSGTPTATLRLVRAEGGAAIGCASRYDAENTNVAVAYSDASRFGCRLEEGSDATGSLAGFFNLSLTLLRKCRRRRHPHTPFARRGILLRPHAMCTRPARM